MIFGATIASTTLIAFQTLLNTLLQSVKNVASAPGATAEMKAAANKAARATAEAALAKLPSADYGAGNQSFIIFRNEVGKAASAYAVPLPPPPPPAPAVPGSALAPNFPTDTSTPSFFDVYAREIKIGGGVALASVVGYVLWRRAGKHARMF